MKEISFPKLRACLFSALLLFLIPVFHANALDSTLETSAGYNDNAARTSEPESSAFLCFRGELRQSLLPDDFFLKNETFAAGEYYDFFQTGDNYRVRAGTALSCPVKQGRIVPGIMMEASLYRDELAEEDERNDIFAGGYVDWLANARVTLTFRQMFTWSDYTNPVLTPLLPVKSQMQGRGNIMGAGGGTRPGAAYPRYKEESRDDHLWGSGAEATLFLMPSVQANVVLGYNLLHSSVEEESCRQFHFSLLLDWTPLETWEIFLLTDISRSDYEELPPDAAISSDRKDNTYRIGLGLSWFWKEYEFRFQYQWEKNDSPLDTEDYRQNVTQCSIIRSF